MNRAESSYGEKETRKKRKDGWAKKKATCIASLERRVARGDERGRERGKKKRTPSQLMFMLADWSMKGRWFGEGKEEKRRGRRKHSLQRHPSKIPVQKSTCPA